MSTAVKKNIDPQGLQESLPLVSPAEQVNILVVDDLPEKLLVYRTILEELGQNLITVDSGEQALKLVLKHEFAVILLDVNMPGMDGFETAALIRQRKKSARTPIIFLTAFTDEVCAAQGYASGAVDYLPTPVVPEILRAKVRVFIELHQMRRQAALQAEERVRRTAAEESALRSAFLVKASELLSRAQNQTEICRSMVELSVPYLADVSVLWLADTEKEQAHAHLAWRNAEGNICSRKLTSLASFPWLAKVVNQMSALDRFQLISNISSAAILDPGQVEPPENIELPCLESALILPLTIRDQPCGVLALMRKQANYQPADISLGRDLVSRTSSALENAMLIERIQEADRRKDEFLGMLAHELRNPLGPIRNAVQLLQMMGPLEPRIQELRDIIDRQVVHMVRLIDDLLDATRLAHGKILLRKESCDLTTLINQTVDDYRSIFEASGLLLSVDVPERPVWVNGDPTRLVQAIGNLLHNAHKFTNPGGQVVVRLSQKKGSDTASVTVCDTGVGIDARMLPVVFDVFRQADQGLDRSRGGLGLGLALVKGLVELHGGTVSVTSEGTDKGSEFTINLPVQAMPSMFNTEPAASIPEGEKYRILVIEDNTDMAESIRQLLRLAGYEVCVAHNGPTGLEMARLFMPQMILCDIGLPEMDGYQVARAIRQDPKLSSICIVAMTGYGRDDDQRQAQQAGFDMHLTKPIDYNNLRRALAYLPITNSLMSA